MKRALLIGIAVLAWICSTSIAQIFTIDTAPPVVVKTVPRAGDSNVDPALRQIEVTFSKEMADGHWSWVQQSAETYPKVGTPQYLPDKRTCVLPVTLEPNKLYVIWINHQSFQSFKDTALRPAIPYLLTFSTRRADASETGVIAGGGGGGGSAGYEGPSAVFLKGLNEDQRVILEWTDRQFRSFFDNRTFEGWSEEDRKQLETKLIDSLRGPQTREYYQAINSLAAMKSTNALPALRQIAYDRREKDNRDRWMAIRAVGLLGGSEDVPELIHLVYHGNTNTRWWAQIALTRITGQNFGSDWNAWGEWWSSQKGQPPYNPEIIRWWSGQAEPDKLRESLTESDKMFLDQLQAKPQGQ